MKYFQNKKFVVLQPIAFYLYNKKHITVFTKGSAARICSSVVML